MRRICVLFIALLFFALSNPAAVKALDALYERNGTAFLLVSDDNFVQDPLDGVYKINRTSSGLPDKLFYPGLTYGIGVNLDLHLNTFSEKKDNPWINYTGPQQKVVNYKQTLGYYTGAAWWHRCINQINGSTRIGGSEGHFPCESHLHAAGNWGVINGAVGGDTGFKLLKIPAGQWYHSSTPADATSWIHSQTAHETLNNSNPRVYDAKSWKMYSDVEKRLYHEYYRHTWKPGDGPGTPPVGPKVAESFEVDIKRNIRNGCFDGCGIDQTVVPLPADKWHTAMVFNRLSKSYFYARKIGATEAYLDIDGVRHNTYPAIGAMFDSSSVNIGVSMKSISEDFVYVLGKKVADNWLSTYYGYPISMNYGGATVSDQWWMKGGSVFFYDRGVGRIYQVERNEGFPDAPGDTYGAKKIEKIIIHSGLGNDLDGIATDGFGSFYYAKTHMVPAKNTDFTYSMRSSVTWGAVTGAIKSGTVKYRQNVYKTVFKKDISGVQTQEGSLLIGHRLFDQNIQYNPYSPTADLTDTARWFKLGDPYLVFSSMGNASRTELVVVNVATPPNTSGEKVANLDMNGPYKDGGAGDYRVEESSDSLSPTVTYKFEVENYPLHNGKVNQRVFTNPDVEERFRRIDRHSGITGSTNGFVGGFVSTLKILGVDNSENVKYTWRIYQAVDSANQVLPERKLIYKRGVGEDYYRPYIFASFDYGEYDIEVSADYQWYNTDLLTYGSTVASLPLVLQSGSGVAKDGTPIAKMRVVVKGAMPALGSVANIRIRREKTPNNWVTRDANEAGAFGDYFVSDEKATERWMVDDPNAAKLIKAIRGTEPPHPGDPNMKPGSKRWLETSLQSNWSARIINPTTNAIGDYYIPPTLSQTIGSSRPQTVDQVDPAFPSVEDNQFYIKTGVSLVDGPDQWKDAFVIPSDPGLYELRCSLKRQILWETVPITYELDFDGNLKAVPGDPEPRSKDILLTGIVKVLVRDMTPPRLDLAEISHKYLYAENLGYIYQTVDGKTPNPAQIVISVTDNNPMAFLNWVRPASVKKHELGIQAASFTYEARADASVYAVAEHPIAVPAARMTVEPKDFGSVYRITIDKNDFTKQMPLHKAIHRKNPIEILSSIMSTDLNMDPLFFGINSIKDTSGNVAVSNPYLKLGEILLIDTKRPNVIISLHDEKYNLTRYSPDSDVFGQHNGYVFVDDQSIWDGKIPSNLGNVNVGGVSVGTMLARFKEIGGQEIEVDSPITFFIRGIDNITASSAIGIDNFSLKRLEPLPAGSVEAISAPQHRRIFRMDAGGTGQTWIVSGEVSDKAVSLPVNSLYYQDPYNPLAEYKKEHRARALKDLPFVVRNTALDVRIIDKSQK